MATAVLGEPREGLGEQPGDAIEDLRLDVVHVGELAEANPVVATSALLELRKCARDLLADVRLAVVGAHGHSRAADVNNIGERGELSLALRCVEAQ